MTIKDMKVWAEVTSVNSRFSWRCDHVSRINLDTLLFYKGYVSGKYLRIDPDGLLSIGYFTGAVLYIGDAVFTEKYRRRFTSKNEAHARCISVLGSQFSL